MARTCPDCGLNLDRYGDRHRCTTKIVGARKPTRLEQEQISKGQLDPASLASTPQQKQSEPLGRLAPRSTGIPSHPARQPQPSPADLMAAIDKLTLAFEALQTVLLAKRADA